MATNLALDDTLLKTALEIGGLKTKRETVNLALDEFIKRRKRQEVIELFGTID
ncbi:MAG: type II toxin-antitoxin system VapB family antitoxin, partial [Treponema sp.]|nr:type II toxin-antitoxin system VapB family antitoxin [Treponema sp.]